MREHGFGNLLGSQNCFYDNLDMAYSFHRNLYGQRIHFYFRTRFYDNWDIQDLFDRHKSDSNNENYIRNVF